MLSDQVVDSISKGNHISANRNSWEQNEAEANTSCHEMTNSITDNRILLVENFPHIVLPKSNKFDPNVPSSTTGDRESGNGKDTTTALSMPGLTILRVLQLGLNWFYCSFINIFFSNIEVLNFIEEKILFEGKKVILVPFFFVFPNFLSGCIEVPSIYLISY